MASSPERSLAVPTAAAAVLSGLGWWFGTGLHPNAWLTWLAPLPLLLLAPRLRWRHAALAALCAGACAGLNLWHYLRHIIGLPLPVGVLAALGPGLAFALSLLLFRQLARRGRYAAAALGFPALWVALDFATLRATPHGTFGSLAYSQLDFLPFVQLGSLTGIWGIVFVLLLVPAALAAALAPGAGRATRLGVPGGAMLLLAAVLAYGYARLQAPAASTMRIGLVSIPAPSRAAVDTPDGARLLKRYLAAIDALGAQGVQAVVLPETAFASTGTAIPAFAQSAARHQLSLVAGVAVRDAGQGERNMALAYRPGVAEPIGYAKRHLIPGFESHYRPGDGYSMLPGTSIGLAVCKDMDFHDIGHAYADRGASLLLVPAWDFAADGRMHSRMAVMRGIESGFAVARAALRGNLTLSDDRGRIVAETSDERGEASIAGTLPLYGSRTLFARWGDWFAWLDLALLAAVLLALRRRISLPESKLHPVGRDSTRPPPSKERP